MHPHYGTEVEVQAVRSSGMLIVQTQQGYGFGIAPEFCDKNACEGIQESANAFCHLEGLLDLVQLLDSLD